MKPASFEYLAPDSLESVLAALTEHGDGAKLLAGGQSLLPVLNFRLAQPAVLVDLRRVPDLDFVRERPDGGLALGAMTRQRRLERSAEVARCAPLLAEALPWVAHPQIRNRGTLGGSLAHADPAAELPAVAVALEARLRLVGGSGERWVAARDFFQGLFATALAADEVLAEIVLPPAPPVTGWAFLEVARRHGDYAMVGVAAGCTLGADGRCVAARLVYLSVGDAPVVAERAAATLVGALPDDAVFARAAALAAGEELAPAGDLHASAEFKRHLARVLTVRALRRATTRARASGVAR